MNRNQYSNGAYVVGANMPGYLPTTTEAFSNLADAKTHAQHIIDQWVCSYVTYEPVESIAALKARDLWEWQEIVVGQLYPTDRNEHSRPEYLFISWDSDCKRESLDLWDTYA